MAKRKKGSLSLKKEKQRMKSAFKILQITKLIFRQAHQ
jgi:hypothetical protein